MTNRYSFTLFDKQFALDCDKEVESAWLAKVLPNVAITEGGPGVADPLCLRTSGPELEKGLYWRDELICPFTGFDNESAQGIESKIQFVLATRFMPEMIFLHAGAVAVNGKGIIFPGRTRSGKSTLTNAFLKRGAAYYSDDCAVIDSGGRLYPYPSPMRLRTGGIERLTIDPGSEGFNVASAPVEVRAILSCEYSGKAAWVPTPVTQGEMVMQLLEHLFLPMLIRDHPKETLSALGEITGRSLLLRGTRNEAEDVVNDILNRL